MQWSVWRGTVPLFIHFVDSKDFVSSALGFAYTGLVLNGSDQKSRTEHGYSFLTWSEFWNCEKKLVRFWNHSDWLLLATKAQLRLRYCTQSCSSTILMRSTLKCRCFGTKVLGGKPYRICCLHVNLLTSEEIIHCLFVRPVEGLFSLFAFFFCLLSLL